MPGQATAAEELRQANVENKLFERGNKIFSSRAPIVEFTKHRDAHAFVLACIMDRQIKAESAWMIPYELSLRLGGFSFDLLSSVSESRFSKVFTEPSNLHRLWPQMSRNTFPAIKRIGDVYEGNAG